MKIDITIQKNKSINEVKSIISSEKLILASPCLLKHQEQWINELLCESQTPRLNFYLNDEKLSPLESTCLYAPFFLQAKNFSTGVDFLNWWIEILALTNAQTDLLYKKLKQVGLTKSIIEHPWQELAFHQKILLCLAPASEKFKLIHLMLGDYFIETTDQVAFNNQLTSYLSLSEIHVVLFWSYTIRDLKSTKLYFTGFKSADFNEESALESRSSK